MTFFFFTLIDFFTNLKQHVNFHLLSKHSALCDAVLFIYSSSFNILGAQKNNCCLFSFAKPVDGYCLIGELWQLFYLVITSLTMILSTLRNIFNT